MSIWKEFIQMTEPGDRRVSPLFQAHHAIITLILVGEHPPLGRYELRSNLTIGEGSVRTLIERLTQNGYIAPYERKGQKLTAKGDRAFNKIMKSIPMGMYLDIKRLALHRYTYVSIVKGLANKIVDGMRQRDEAIICGGYDNAGATTLVMRNGLLVIPPKDIKASSVDKKDASLIMRSLKPEDDDTIIIGSAINGNLAREVSIAAVMTLFEDV